MPFRALANGWEVSDLDVDAFYPEWARSQSEIHWTPVRVAQRAAQLLAVDSAFKILDVGSGVGKFCLIGASVTRGVFVGVEQRISHVELARDAAFRAGLLRARFVHADMADLDWSSFDGFYLFNPFSGSRLRDQQVAVVRSKLSGGRLGTRVVTYHGFGGAFPEDYDLMRREPAGTGTLELWQKTRPGGRGRAA
jgi:predicted RNA methylase